MGVEAVVRDQEFALEIEMVLDKLPSQSSGSHWASVSPTRRSVEIDLASLEWL